MKTTFLLKKEGIFGEDRVQSYICMRSSFLIYDEIFRLPSEGNISAHRVGTVLSFFSSRRYWDSPNPTPAGECGCPWSGGRGTLAGERGGGRVPIPTRGHTLLYSLYICTLWFYDSYTEHEKLFSYFLLSPCKNRKVSVLKVFFDTRCSVIPGSL